MSDYIKVTRLFGQPLHDINSEEYKREREIKRLTGQEEDMEDGIISVEIEFQEYEAYIRRDTIDQILGSPMGTEIVDNNGQGTLVRETPAEIFNMLSSGYTYKKG